MQSAKVCMVGPDFAGETSVLQDIAQLPYTTHTMPKLAPMNCNPFDATHFTDLGTAWQDTYQLMGIVLVEDSP